MCKQALSQTESLLAINLILLPLPSEDGRNRQRGRLRARREFLGLMAIRNSRNSYQPKPGCTKPPRLRCVVSIDWTIMNRTVVSKAMLPLILTVLLATVLFIIVQSILTTHLNLGGLVHPGFGW